MSQDALSRLSLLVAIGLDNLHSNIAVRTLALNSTNKHRVILLTQEANATLTKTEHYKSDVKDHKYQIKRYQ